MNKNTKKFVVTLLSVLMVLSFMPAMAFAATPATGSHEWAEPYESYDGVLWVDADYEGLNVLIAPTCDDYGVGQITCAADDLNDEKCNFKKTVYINSLGHKPGRRIRAAADELMDHCIYQYDADDKKAFYKSHPTFCEGYVWICEDCGAYLGRYKLDDKWYYYEIYTPMDADEPTQHVAPAGTKACAASFTCTTCNVAKVQNDEFNAVESAKYHTAGGSKADITTAQKKVHIGKEWTTEDSVQGGGPRPQTYEATFTWEAPYVELTTVKCNICGEEMVDQDSAVVYGYKGGEAPVLKERSGSDRVPTPNPLPDEDRPELKHGTTTRVVTVEPTCTANGLYEDQCKDCGIAVESGEIDMLPHDYKLVEPYYGEFPGRIDKVVYQAEVCSCGAVKKDSIKPVGFETPDAAVKDRSYSVIADATCEQGAWILRTTTWTDGDVTTAIFDDTEIEEAIADKEIVLINGKYYAVDSEKEIPYTPALGHKFGALTKVADATCTEPAIEGKVCEKCNCVDHATLRSIEKPLGHDVTTVTVAPTCGEYGYTYDTCARCKQVVLPDGAKDTDYIFIGDLQKYADVYNVVKPLVSLGAPCTFEWKVVKEATADADGTKAEVCSVCGTTRNEVPYSLTEDEKKQAARAEAEPVMSAAADIAADASYTDATKKAIESAQADLKAALAAGSANDVKIATAALQQAIDNAAKKAANTMTVKAKTVKAKAKKATTIKKAKAFTVKKAKGSVTFKKLKGNKKISVSKAGKVVVKKGLKKGQTYKVKVRVTAAGNGDYLAKSKTVTLKVKIK